jgi:hypothetical protein
MRLKGRFGPKNHRRIIEFPAANVNFCRYIRPFDPIDPPGRSGGVNGYGACTPSSLLSLTRVYSHW